MLTGISGKSLPFGCLVVLMLGNKPSVIMAYMGPSGSKSFGRFTGMLVRDFSGKPVNLGEIDKEVNIDDWYVCPADIALEAGLVDDTPAAAANDSEPFDYEQRSEPTSEELADHDCHPYDDLIYA